MSASSLSIGNTSLNFLVLLLYTLFFILGSDAPPSFLSAAIVFVGLFGFFRNPVLTNPWVWWSLLAVLLYNLYGYYFIVANHHFLLVYLVFATALQVTFSKDQRIFLTTLKCLGALVLGGAALQKAWSSEFTSGAFYFYMLNTGHFFKPFFYFFKIETPQIEANVREMYRFGSKAYASQNPIVLKSAFPQARWFCLIFSWITIFYEAVVAVLLFLKPSDRFTHLCFLFLIVGIFLVRPHETGFLTQLSIIGLFLNQDLRFRQFYLLLIAGFSALMLCKLTYY